MRIVPEHPFLKKNWNNKFNIKLRIRYALVMCTMIVLGLGSRHFSSVPHFVAIHFGDALWAGTVYFVLRLLSIKRPPVCIAFLSLAISFVIEISQLYQAAWINEIRQTLPGALLLGHGFLWMDLLRYATGVFLAGCVDKVIISFK